MALGKLKIKAKAAVVPEHEASKTLGRYRILEEVGRGGYGWVYRAVDNTLGRLVALKEMAPHIVEKKKERDRFLLEARAVAKLKHPNIASVFEFGEENGRLFIAFEWVEGITLKSLLESQKSLEPLRALRLLRQMAAGLDYAHSRGVVHCDFKPGNILINSAGELTIVDFGLSWLAQSGDATITQSVIGTPSYMAPEQIQGETLDGRTDQYSLAFVIFEMLAGEVPFPESTYAALLSKHLHATPPALSEVKPGLPISLSAALERAMAKTPAQRFPSCQELYKSIETALAPPLARHGRGRLVALIAAQALLLTALGVAWKVNSTTIIPTNPAPVLQTVRSPQGPESGSVWHGRWSDSGQAGSMDSEFSPLEATPRWQTTLAEAGEDPMIGFCGALGEAVVAYKSGRLEAYDWENGAPRWSIALTSPLLAPPTLSTRSKIGVIGAVTEKNELIGIDLKDGKELWKIGADELPGGLYGGVTLNEHGWFFGVCTRGRLVAVDPYQGKIRWKLDFPEEGESLLPPTLASGCAILAFKNGTLLGLDRSRREVVWKATLPARPVAVSLDRSSGAVMAASSDGHITCFSLMRGKQLWQIQNKNGDLVGIQVGFGKLVAFYKCGHVCAWSIRDGAPRWLTKIGSPATAPPLADRHTILLCCSDGLHYLVADSGQEIHTRQLLIGKASNPALLGSWLLAKIDGQITALGPAP